MRDLDTVKGVVIMGDNCLANCPLHSGIISEVEGLKDWKVAHVSYHNNYEQSIEQKFDKLQNRLPVWATFLISTLTLLVGWSIALIQVAK